MGSTEAQLLQGTYYSFGVGMLLEEVVRIGVDTRTEDKLVIDIFAEFNNFLAALVCRNPMLQSKVLAVVSGCITFACALARCSMFLCVSVASPSAKQHNVIFSLDFIIFCAHQFFTEEF